MNLEQSNFPIRTCIEIKEKDTEKAKEILTDNGIFIVNIFGDPYEQAMKENIEFFIHEASEKQGMISEESECIISDMSLEQRGELVDKTLDLLWDNEYLSQTFNECTTDAIEGGLRELFIKKEK